MSRIVLSVGMFFACGLFLFVSVGAVPAMAQTDSTQLDALTRLQDAQDARHRAAQEAAAQQERAAAVSRQAQVRARQAALHRQQQALAVQRAREYASDRDYLEQTRLLELEHRRLQLKMETAKADHAEDYATADLRNQAMQTDTIAAANQTIRSEAESDAMLKRDMGEALKSVGQADKMKQRHWWEW